MMREAMRQDHHALQRQYGQNQTSELNPSNYSVQYRSGILIFSRRQNLLYVDRQVLELIDHPDQSECGRNCENHMAPLCEFRNSIQAALDHRRTAGIWEPFELRRVFFEPKRKILMRGLGLIDRDVHEDSSIVITLEEIGLRQEQSEPQGQAMRLSQERGDDAFLGSVQLGSAHGMFNVGMDGAP